MPLSRKIYSQLPQHPEGDEESSEKLLGDDSKPVVSPRSDSLDRRWLSFWLPHVALFSLYTILYVALYIIFVRGQSVRSRIHCLQETSLYSPVHEAVRHSIVRFNASLDFPSGYSGHPTPAIDEAWDRITTNNTLWPIRVSNNMLEKIHKGGRASNVRYRDDDGGGSMGTIEVFHQLHCLNLIRKHTYLDEYPDVKMMFHKRPKFMRSHLGTVIPIGIKAFADISSADHCIEIMRQNLMCNADVGVISYDWIKGHEIPFPDFNTYHKCRNFDDILDWASNHRVHVPASHIYRLGDEVDLLEEPV